MCCSQSGPAGVVRERGCDPISGDIGEVFNFLAYVNTVILYIETMGGRLPFKIVLTKWSCFWPSQDPHKTI